MVIFLVCDVFDGKEFSLPDPLNREQIFDTVEKYLNEHPEILHEAGSTLVVNALTEAFPIKSPAQPDSQNQNSVKAKEKDKKSRDKMDRCFILTGLFFNLIGVILIYPGIKPNKDGISQTLIGDGKSEVNYMPKFNYWFLGSGLICLIVGITFQIIGVLIN